MDPIPSSSPAQSWRTAFLTLRDETSTLPTRVSVDDLLHNLIFSNPSALIAAAPSLPHKEVTSDLIFLIELVSNASYRGLENVYSLYGPLYHLVRGACSRIPLDLNDSSWIIVLESFGKCLEVLLGKGFAKRAQSGSIRSMVDCLEILRCLIAANHQKSSLSENIELVKFLCRNIELYHLELYSVYGRGNNSSHASNERAPRFSALWDVHTLAFTMLGDACSRVGSSLPVDIRQLVIQVVRREMDVLASQNRVVEESLMSRYYAALFQCLHVLIADTKFFVADHVPSFIEALRKFITYGITSHGAEQYIPSVRRNMEDNATLSQQSEPRKTDRKPYRPPHLRKKDNSSAKLTKNHDIASTSDGGSSASDLMSSDSDYSENDGLERKCSTTQSSKVRVAAIVCIQDMCQADPKSFTSQWTMLLPTTDVLELRRFNPTLMTCLLFDPYLKARITAASAVAIMLSAPSSTFMQMAEYSHSSKRGSFTSLSSSIGEILLQLHKGITHLITRETHGGFLTSLFKILMLLLASTPYARLPDELLPATIKSLEENLEKGISFREDQNGHLAAAISCMSVALSASPSSSSVEKMLTVAMPKDYLSSPEKLGVVYTLLRYCEPTTNMATRLEAIQALRALIHNYPKVMLGSWQHISMLASTLLGGYGASNFGVLGEKVTSSIVKVLDEFLRAACGFKGIEDLMDDTLPEAPFTSDCVKIKKISSAPSIGAESSDEVNDHPEVGQDGTDRWCEAIEKYLPVALQHPSAVVRSSAITCFAGITSEVFCFLPMPKQKFVLSSIINAALEDRVPSVRSAACRAIGVTTCFPKISQSAEILHNFIHAVLMNTNHSLVAVRVTASWALANICNVLNHYVEAALPRDCDISGKNVRLLALFECALRLTNDVDKVKANAVRALGNLSRYVICSPLRCDGGVVLHPSSLRSSSGGDISDNDLQNNEKINPGSAAFAEGSLLMGRMVQAILSCVTTGNVKVQWNVCYAVSNLFRNGTLNLKDENWAPPIFSILLLLLRDSSNFKIKIQAAAALAVPASVGGYGSSFSDVVQGLEHVLENPSSTQISAPSSFSYRAALEKQLTFTMLHVLSLASGADIHSLQDFLVKKSSFLEDWLKGLCSSLMDSCGVDDVGGESQKKEIIFKAVSSLVEIYQKRNQRQIAERVEVKRGGIHIMYRLQR
ncbi:hypothetical protein MLD38_016610 [Melastoma candidum]|uniref:Uncharacterized protein n=1 Tax=Melastoma candidum TaxID=119954 RepID=A0ACB9QMC1_9MYRT|nr:hypothetical protein MLD38_016610 [Melastoma candidum]